MDNGIVIAIITASATILVAALTFWLTKRHELRVAWRQQKAEHYNELLSAISDLAVDGINKEKANRRFAQAVNTIGLVGSQQVITALMNFHDEVKYSNPNPSVDKHDELIVKLVLAIRQDIGLSVKDNNSNFKFHLIGNKPPSKRIR